MTTKNIPASVPSYLMGGYAIGQRLETAFHALATTLKPVKQTLVSWWVKWKSQRDARDAFAAVTRLDDRMLDDIGHSRAEVEWAAGLPLNVDAARALRDLRELRRGL